MDRVPVVIATPVEAELVDRLRRGRRAPRRPLRAGPAAAAALPVRPRRRSLVRAIAATRSGASAALVAGAEVLYGIPARGRREQIAWAVRTAPGLRFVQATSAGAGEQLAAAGLSREELERIQWASSAACTRRRSPNGASSASSPSRKGLPRLRRRHSATGTGTTTPSTSCADATVLVVGLGEIGREVARLAEAFGMNVVSVRARRDGDLDELVSPQADCDRRARCR